jgi:hypothetical protein
MRRERAEDVVQPEAVTCLLFLGQSLEILFSSPVKGRMDSMSGIVALSNLHSKAQIKDCKGNNDHLPIEESTLDLQKGKNGHSTEYFMGPWQVLSNHYSHLSCVLNLSWSLRSQTRQDMVGARKQISDCISCLQYNLPHPTG